VRLPSVVGARKLTIVAGQALWVSYPRIVHQLPVTDCGSRHVIVMVLDGWARRRFDSQHPTEPGRKLTPNLDRFFAEGFHAPNGFSSSEWTLPASASFFTGKYASRHQMVNPVLPMRYKSDEKLLAEYFQQAGYQTLGLSCGSRLTPAFGSHRGFDRFIYHWANEGRTTFDYDPVVWINESSHFTIGFPRHKNITHSKCSFLD
jgi:arylsulfatase A-like enzyme